MNARPPAPTFAFQPVIDARQRQVIGYEALLRGPQGQASAEVFNRVSMDDVAAFDRDARRTAIALATRLELKGNLHLNVAADVRTAVSLTVEDAVATAQDCGLGADRLVIELKHEPQEGKARALCDWLRPYRARGAHISFDDFGWGYAGLELLAEFQPQLVSLSMRLIRGIDSHGPRQAILRGVMQICGDLGIDVVAKGVQTETEYAWLRDEGVTLFQGYLFAPPGFESLPRPNIPAQPA